MPIPEHVRKQAMDAVSHYSTTARIRAYGDSGISASPGSQFTYSEPTKAGYAPLTDEVRRKAMDAVSHPEIQARVRLAQDNEVFAPSTPSRQSMEIAEKITRMRLEGRDVERAHKEITRDGFGQEYG